MEDVARLYGTFQTILSGNRTKAEQLKLYDNQTNRPAAYPGCSQHQYGLAADVTWAPMTAVTSKGKLFLYGRLETDRHMNNAARHVGLTLVAGDTGHFQAYNGIAFRNWAVSAGLCPVNPPLSARQSLLLREAAEDRRSDDRTFGPISVFGSNFFRRGFF